MYELTEETNEIGVEIEGVLHIIPNSDVVKILNDRSEIRRLQGMLVDAIQDKTDDRHEHEINSPAA